MDVHLPVMDAQHTHLSTDYLHRGDSVGNGVKPAGVGDIFERQIFLEERHVCAKAVGGALCLLSRSFMAISGTSACVEVPVCCRPL